VVGDAATGFISGVAGTLAIGLVTYTTNAVLRTRKASIDSPFRYLSLMEEAGVVFRTESSSSADLQIGDTPS